MGTNICFPINMNPYFDLSHPALTLKYWQTVVTFGETVVDQVINSRHWHKIYAEALRAEDIRAKYDTILSGEIIHEIAGQLECLDDYYLDPDGQRLYAVSRKRKWSEPSFPETKGFLKISNQEALKTCGAFCLFMASDRSIGYCREKDLLRLTNDSENISAKTKLLWTIDDRGANFVLEQQPWDSFRGIVAHINISQRACCGGEAWRTNKDMLTINCASRDFGFNCDFPESLMDEARKRYDLAIEMLRSYNLKVIARPFGTR